MSALYKFTLNEKGKIVSSYYDAGWDNKFDSAFYNETINFFNKGANSNFWNQYLTQNKIISNYKIYTENNDIIVEEI